MFHRSMICHPGPRAFIFSVLAVATLGISCTSARQAPVAIIPNADYRVIHGWPVLPENTIFEEVSSVAVDSSGNVLAAVQRVVKSGSADALIMGGDLNLVGSRRPLDLLERDLDLDGTSLAIVGGLQLNGRSNATWRASDPCNARFPPKPSGLVAFQRLVPRVTEVICIRLRRSGAVLADAPWPRHFGLYRAPHIRSPARRGRLSMAIGRSRLRATDAIP